MNKLVSAIVFIGAASVLGACGGGGGNGGDAGPATYRATSLNQAGFDKTTDSFVYGGAGLQNVGFNELAPDADQYRWAMLDDGTQRIFMFKGNENTTLYMYGYNPNTGTFQPGYNGNFTYGISGMPADADPTSIGMLSDNYVINGERAKFLFMKSLSNPTKMYHFMYDATTNNFSLGYAGSATEINITGAPADTDWDRWGMMHDGFTYYLITAKAGVDNMLYQFRYNTTTRNYEYFTSRGGATAMLVENMPADTFADNFAVLHDGKYYRFYQWAP